MPKKSIHRGLALTAIAMASIQLGIVQAQSSAAPESDTAAAR
jgi:hypothetical protein